MIKYVSTSKPRTVDQSDHQPSDMIEDITEQQQQQQEPDQNCSAQTDIQVTPQPDSRGKMLKDLVDPISMLSESLSTMSLTPEIKVFSPTRNADQDNSFVTPPTNNKMDLETQPISKNLCNPETIPVSIRDSVNKAKNLQNLLKTPEAVFANYGDVAPNSGRTTRRKSFSCHPQTDHEAPLSPGERRRHTSEGEVQPKKLRSGPLSYKKFGNQEDGLYSCDGKSFHLTNKFLKKVPKTVMSRPKLLEELKQSLLDITPEITPGQSSLSHTDITWETTEMDKSSLDNQWCALKTLVNKINQQVAEITDQDPKFNGLRLIYASDRSVKMNLRAVSDENLPLVALHIGQPRDLSIAPMKFSPHAKAQEIICDISLGNYSLITWIR